MAIFVIKNPKKCGIIAFLQGFSAILKRVSALTWSTENHSPFLSPSQKQSLESEQSPFYYH